MRGDMLDGECTVLSGPLVGLEHMAPARHLPASEQAALCERNGSGQHNCTVRVAS